MLFACFYNPSHTLSGCARGNDSVVRVFSCVVTREARDAPINTGTLDTSWAGYSRYVMGRQKAPGTPGKKATHANATRRPLRARGRGPLLTSTSSLNVQASHSITLCLLIPASLVPGTGRRRRLAGGVAVVAALAALALVALAAMVGTSSLSLCLYNSS